MIQILIADDHEVVRQGIRSLLEGREGWRICGEASTGREAVDQAQLLRPDIVVLDVAMPEMNGLEAARQIHRIVPQAGILILTVHETEKLARDFIEAGARGYLLKSDAGRMLVEAVEALVHRGTYFSARVQAVIDDPNQHRATVGHALRDRLTPREREVLQLLAEGKSNKEIGVTLQISTKTAETHRARLMSKLGVHSVAELVRYAIRNQIVEA